MADERRSAAVLVKVRNTLLVVVFIPALGEGDVCHGLIKPLQLCDPQTVAACS